MAAFMRPVGRSQGEGDLTMFDKPLFRWSDETVHLLRVCAINGLTASQSSYAICERYRNGPSRNAVIGKAHRLGIQFGGTSGPTPYRTEKIKAPSPRRGFPWSRPECDAKFRELIAAGCSTREIMAGLAKAFPQLPLLTVAAVQVHAGKLGLSIRGGRPGPSSKSPQVQASRNPAPGSAALQRAQDSGRGADFLPGVPPALDLPAPIGGVPLLDLEHGMCKWPIGDPRDIDSFRYCGADATAGQSYCRGHSALAYIPAKDRKRTKAQEDADDKRRAYAMQRWASGLRVA
ncbi:MAG: GcrA family cell cycle regulator [Beijerinckiaceae bacterium]